MSNKVIIGRFGTSHGIEGWIKIISFTEPLDNICQYQHCLIKHGHSWQEIYIQHYKIHGKTILAKMDGCNTPEQARQYTNQEIAILREQLPSLAQDNYYWHDLEGFNVINKPGIVLGKLDHILATGANDVLVVKGERERLIPYIKTVIVKVDLDQKTIIVDWDPEY